MIKYRFSKRLFGEVATCLCSLLVASPLNAATFSEPATTFYGKVLAVSPNDRPQLLHRGELTWRIRMPDNTELALRTTLYALRDGEFSYRLDIPHKVLSLGLVMDGVVNAVPLTFLTSTYSHFDIKVDGQKAHMIGPAGTTFDLHQAMRASAFRLDLVIDRAPQDLDGDGIPDWWEDLYGLDKQDAGDALLDPDGDGLDSRREYLAGLDPSRDSRLPLLDTRELMIYADGTSGLLLHTLDIDSSPEQLTYTLTRAPRRGQLLMRNQSENPQAPDGTLGDGDTFTQADVQQGRVIFRYDGDGVQPIPLEVSVRDENAEHPPTEGEIVLFPYRPSPQVADPADGEPEWVKLSGSTRLVEDMAADEDRRLKNYLLSRSAGFEVRDASSVFSPRNMSAPSTGLSATNYFAEYVVKYGADLRQILVGGAGADHLRGGMEGDVLMGGGGNDHLEGNGGSDWFVWQGSVPGDDTVEDFRVQENDVLDLSAVVEGTGQFAGDYISLEWVEGNPTVLHVDANGDGSGYTDFSITLPGLAQNEADLSFLIDNGHLIVDGLNVKPRVTVLALDSTASENGPRAGSFELTRSGSLVDALWVNIQMDGSAENGRDYSTISGPIRIPAGASRVLVTVTPFVDSETEADEVVELVVLPSADYFAGLVDRASMTIEDLRLTVDVETLSPLAIKDTTTPGLFLIKRSAILDRSVLVRLAVQGTAANGVDYQTISGFVNMVPYQTTAIIEVIPLPGAVLNDGRESIVLTILPDVSYRVGSGARARVTLVERTQTLEDWRDEHFPHFQGTIDEFANSDSGGLGVPNLLRYAYGLGVENPDLSRLPKFSLRNGRLTVDLFQNPAATDIEYRVAISSDLSEEWDESSIGVEKVQVVETQSDPGASCYQARETTGNEEGLFMLIEIRRTP